MNDYELVYYAQEGDEDAYNILLNKYQPLLYNVILNGVRYYDLSNLDFDDIYAEVIVTFNRAINKYDAESGVIFNTFLRKCVKTSLNDIYRENKKILNNEVTYFIGDLQGNSVIEEITSNKYIPDEELISNENIVNIRDELYRSLSSYEKKIVELKLEGYSNADISLEFGKSFKSIYSAMGRIKLKLNDIIKGR